MDFIGWLTLGAAIDGIILLIVADWPRLIAKLKGWINERRD